MQIPKINIRAFFKTDRAILIICISIAFVFWLFTKLSETNETDIFIKVNFDLPAGKTLLNPPPQILNATIEGEGWDLILQSFRRKSQKITIILKSDSVQTIGYQQLSRETEKALIGDLTVKNITPEIIPLNVDNYFEQLVVVNVDADINTAPQHKLAAPVTIIPQKVTAQGPATIVKKLSTWKTETLIFSDLTDDLYNEVEIQKFPNSQIKFAPNKVDYAINVEQFTEKIVEVPIEFINMTDSVIIYPNTITVIFSVGLSSYDKVEANQFTAIVDWNKKSLGLENGLEVELIQYPSFINRVDYTPTYVEYMRILDSEIK